MYMHGVRMHPPRPASAHMRLPHCAACNHAPPPQHTHTLCPHAPFPIVLTVWRCWLWGDPRYGLQVDYLTEPDFKKGLVSYLQRTGVQAIVLGTRR